MRLIFAFLNSRLKRSFIGRSSTTPDSNSRMTSIRRLRCSRRDVRTLFKGASCSSESKKLLRIIRQFRNFFVSKLSRFFQFFFRYRTTATNRLHQKMNRFQTAIALLNAVIIKALRLPIAFGNVLRSIQEMFDADRKLLGFLPQIFQITFSEKRHIVKIDIRRMAKDERRENFVYI